MKPLPVFFLEQQLVDMDKRTREALSIKAKIKELTVFQQIKNVRPCLKNITSSEFKKIINDAGVYYSIRYQEQDWQGLTRSALVSYIRHNYTNYRSFLDQLNELRIIPCSYRDYRQSDRYYSRFKQELNDLIEKNVELF
ncbi:MAG: hypothetical protein ACFFD4_02510 [Candidatus Odinarchaeota archaeon]